jgi:hypothetical protein
LQALQKERETLEALRPELTEGKNIYIFFLIITVLMSPSLCNRVRFQREQKAKNKIKSEMFFFSGPLHMSNLLKGQ